MAHPQSLAKITRPQPLRALPRARLFEQLDQGRERRLTWITAPPGAGKTTLVCSYLDTRKLPCLWYQVDTGDTDLAAFFHYLGLAVARAAPRYRRSMPKLTPEYLAGIPTFTRNFFRELARRLNQPHLLVFDNLQEVDPAAPLYEVLREGLCELPADLHGVLISRSNPAPNFARMRVSGQLTELDWDALRLRLEESVQFVRCLDNRGTALPMEQLMLLHEQCEGWTAGLILLLEGVTAHTPVQRVFDPATAQSMFDYFAAEVFARRSPAVKELLMLTALFPSFTATMAERISGTARAATWLDDLVCSHHFTERRSGAGGDYQYHPLFRSFLLAQARKTWGLAELTRCRHKAATLLEEAGRAEEALALYLDTEDWNAATRLILQHAPTVMAAGRFLTLGAALQRLPASELAAEPWLAYWLGVCSMAMDPGAALLRFDTAFARFEHDRNATGAYLAWAGAVEAIGFQMTDYDQFGPWLERLDRLSQAYPEFPNSEIEVRVQGNAIIAYTWHQPAHPSLVRWMQRATTLVYNCDHPIAVAHLVLYWTDCWFWYGSDNDAAAAAEMLGHAGSLMARLADAPFEQILIKLAEATLSTAAGDTDRALAAVEAGLAISERSGVHLMDVMLIGWSAFACLGAGRLAAADLVLQRMQEWVEAVGSRLDREFYWLMYAWHAALAGDFPTALRRLAICLPIQEELHAIPTRTNVLLTQGFYQVELGELDAVRSTLVRADDLLRGTPNGHFHHMRAMLAAHLACAGHREAEACELLGQAVQIGCFRYPGLLPASVARLCALALERDIEADAARTLIRRLQLAPPDSGCLEWPLPVKVHTLGKFNVQRDGAPLGNLTKVGRKPLLLLQAIIALGGRGISQQHLTEALWPDAEGDSQVIAFETALSRLRKLIGKDSIVLKGGSASLNERSVWLDCWALERLLLKLEKALGTNADAAEVERLAKRLFTLYQGPFLGEESEQAWILPYRVRCCNRFLRCLGQLGRHWETAQEWRKALDCHLRGLEVEPLAEQLYRDAMRCHRELRQPAEALALYEQCRAALKAALNLTPTAETEALRRSLLT